MVRFKNDGDVSFKCGALDPLGQYFAATACDGMLYIFKVPQESEGNSGSLLHKVRITKNKVVPFESNPLEVVWRPDGSELFVSGEILLGVVSRETWNLTLNKDYGHKKAISCITWFNDHIFATAGLDNVIKIWDLNKRALLFYITLTKPAIQLSYCQKNKCLAFMNYECNLGIWGNDFADAIVPPTAAAPVQVDEYMNQEDVAVEDLPDNFFS